jgi:transcriptional regulator GlxA family with amidase domain
MDPPASSLIGGRRINPAFPVAPKVEGAICDDILTAIKFIKQQYQNQDLSLDMVAEHVFVSRYHFSRKFHEQTGRRFIDYLIMVRLTAARRLLMETEMTVTAIASAVGYRDLSNFERSFKKLFAVPPSQYRQRYTMPAPTRDEVTDDGFQAAS